MILIGVKSKYGSCSGNCTGFININNTPSSFKYKGIYVGKYIYNIYVYILDIISNMPTYIYI